MSVTELGQFIRDVGILAAIVIFLLGIIVLMIALLSKLVGSSKEERERIGKILENMLDLLGKTEARSSKQDDHIELVTQLMEKIDEENKKDTGLKLAAIKGNTVLLETGLGKMDKIATDVNVVKLGQEEHSRSNSDRLDTIESHLNHLPETLKEALVKQFEPIFQDWVEFRKNVQNTLDVNRDMMATTFTAWLDKREDILKKALEQTFQDITEVIINEYKILSEKIINMSDKLPDDGIKEEK